jgi:hypothetical protein
MSLERSPSREATRYAFTIAEFCDAHRISRSWLYQEWGAGRGPRVKSIGSKKIITAEAAREWREQNDAPAAA